MQVRISALMPGLLSFFQAKIVLSTEITTMAEYPQMKNLKGHVVS
jgi:hypothetical protein